MTVDLTRRPTVEQHCLVAANSASGIGLSLKERTSAHAATHGAFFLPVVLRWARVSQSYGGRCAGGFGPAGLDSFPVDQPAPAATSLGLAGANSYVEGILS